MLAMPHKTGTRAHSASEARLLGPKLETNTEYSRQFAERPFCYCSMDDKPLTLYDPLAHRSRNMTEDVVMPYKNASVVQFDAGMVGRPRKPFITTQRMYHDGQMA